MPLLTSNTYTGTASKIADKYWFDRVQTGLTIKNNDTVNKITVYVADDEKTLAPQETFVFDEEFEYFHVKTKRGTASFTATASGSLTTQKVDNANKAYKTYVTPEDFGALPNTESYTNFRNMIDYAKTNKIACKIQRKNYKISSPLTLTGGEVFLGDNGSDSLGNDYHIIYTGNSDYLFRAGNTSNISATKFSGLQLSGTSKTGGGIKLSSQRAVVTECSFNGFDKCIYCYPHGANVVENLISKNFFLESNQGINIYSTSEYSYSDSVIEKNYFSNCAQYGIYADLIAQWKICKNQMYGSAANIGAVDIYFEGYLNSIEGNNFGGHNINIQQVNTGKSSLTYNHIINNTFIENMENIIRKCIILEGDLPIADVIISLNTFVSLYDTTTFYSIFGVGTGVKTPVFTNNITAKAIMSENIKPSTVNKTNAKTMSFRESETKPVIGFLSSSEITAYGQSPTGSLLLDISNGLPYISQGAYGNKRIPVGVTNLADSAAVDVAALKTDFNLLLAKLRGSGILY